MTAIRPQPLSQTPPPMRLGRHGEVTRPSLLRTSLSTVGLLAGVIAIAFLINSFWLQSYYVEGTSMTPTLRNHDRLVIDKAGASFSHLTGTVQQPKRGDIVIVDSQLRDASGSYEQLIKRVIGLPGEHIIVKDGSVTVYNQQNNNGFDPDKLLKLTLAPTYSQSTIDVQIAKDEVFIMGDNRAPGGSLDSRAFGPVKLSALEGRLWARILPVGGQMIF